mmetsp:Transcript_120711/g.375837  ORF Transcript_120711/g.375837 Transcript_120711/m.375837 type:complete len:110 (+) Transcript_120711:1946-2275(+)
MERCQNDLLARNRELETKLERALGDAEMLRQQKLHSDTEHALQMQFVNNAERQARLVESFLERESQLVGDSHGALADDIRETAKLGPAERSGRSSLGGVQRSRAYEGGA